MRLNQKVIAKIGALAAIAAALANGQQKSVSQSVTNETTIVTNLLNAPDPSLREYALDRIAASVDRPHLIINGPITLRKPLDLTITPSLLEKLLLMAQSDNNLSVRINALETLRAMRFRTNSSPLIGRCLTNENGLVRVRAARILIQINQDYHENLDPDVIPTLVQMLGTNEEPEVAWQAAAYLGQLGADAHDALPALKRAKKHPSKKVRQYASDAIRAIQRQARDRSTVSTAGTH